MGKFDAGGRYVVRIFEKIRNILGRHKHGFAGFLDSDYRRDAGRLVSAEGLVDAPVHHGGGFFTVWNAKGTRTLSVIHGEYSA